MSPEKEVKEKMTAQTKMVLMQVFKSDRTVSPEEARAFASFMGGGVVQRVASREEAAQILGIGVKRVDDFTRSGALRRVYYSGNRRASGILMSSIDDMIAQGVR